MSKQSTKEIIIEKALELFSKKGFAAVSMRELADAVGIQVSSIYHYYKSKQDLFQGMIDQTVAVMEQCKASFIQALGNTESVEKEPFINAGVMMVAAYRENNAIAPLLKMLESERFHDDLCNQTWNKIFFESPLEHQKNVFDILYKRGEIKDKDSSKLAGEYHAIITLGYFTGDMDMVTALLGSFYDREFG